MKSPGRWLGLFRSDRPDDGFSPRLIPGRPPVEPLENWLVEKLAGGTVVPRRQVVRRLAERWLAEEMRLGAANLDIGIWRPTLFQPAAEDALQRLEGDLIQPIARPGSDLAAGAAGRVGRSPGAAGRDDRRATSSDRVAGDRPWR